MSNAQEILAHISAAAPSLRSWSEQMQLEGPSIGEVCTQLAAELVEHRRDRRIPELSALASVIGTLLQEDDEQDTVSLGFLEPLVWRALDGTLDASQIRDDLGPDAVGVWDGLYLGSRQDDLRAVEYHERELGPAAKTPAQLVEWLLPPNRWVAAETPVARLSVKEREAQLRVKAKCWIDRFAAPAGHSLQVGDLLFYVAPESPGVPKTEPLCAVTFSGPAA